jgi:putative peptidoglycan lipid II flippase
VSDTVYLIRSTAVVTVWRTVGVVAGFLLDAYVLATFGLGKGTDAFFVAMAIPTLIDGTLGIQLTQALPPILASIREEQGLTGAVRLLNALTALWVVIACLIAVLVAAVAGAIVPLQAPGLLSEALESAGNMSMILAWLIPLSGLVAILQGALFWRHQFGLTSATRAVNSACVICAVALFQRSLGIYSLALGYVAGYVMQVIVLGVALRRTEVTFEWVWDPTDQHLRSAIRLITYPLTGQMLGECRTLLENYFISFYPAGVLSALRYASRLVFAISGLAMTGVVTATAPMIAHYVAVKDLSGMKRTVRNGLQLLLFMSIPIVVLLTFSGTSIVSILFERGEFSRREALLTGTFVALLAPYIFFSRAISLTQTPFYAVKNTRALTLSIVLSFFAYALLLPILQGLFGIYGFPAATTLSTGLGVLIVAGLIHRSFGALGWSRVRDVALRLSAAGAGMAIVLSLVERAVGTVAAGSLQSLVTLAIPAVLGLSTFLALAVALRVVDPISSWREQLRHGFARVDFGA